MSLTGEEGRQPVKSAVPVADVSAAIFGFGSILASLLWRERSSHGSGQHIDLSMLDVMVSMLTVVGTRYLLNGEIPPRQGTQNPQRVPSAAFECADGSLLQVVPNQRQWPTFCKLLDHPEWAEDERFATPAGRVESRDELYPLVRAAMRAKDRATWQAQFDAQGIACGPINNLAEVFADPQVVERQMVRSYEFPGLGEVPAIALPFRYSQTACTIGRPPLLGEHTVEVLAELGRSQAQIEALLGRGAVRDAQRNRVDSWTA
jgi:crotonobetainyl-CoA:carnitine CoA-transferase CaiB-like acyl-CoA transferase